MPSIRNAASQNTDPLPGSEGFDSSTLTRARLDQWVRGAQPNAQLVYGHGDMASEAAPPDLREHVMSLAAKGWVTPHFIRGRSGTPHRHIVMRTNRPFLNGSTL